MFSAPLSRILTVFFILNSESFIEVNISDHNVFSSLFHFVAFKITFAKSSCVIYY